MSSPFSPPPKYLIVAGARIRAHTFHGLPPPRRPTNRIACLPYAPANPQPALAGVDFKIIFMVTQAFLAHVHARGIVPRCNNTPCVRLDMSSVRRGPSVRLLRLHASVCINRVNGPRASSYRVALKWDRFQVPESGRSSGNSLMPNVSLE